MSMASATTASLSTLCTSFATHCTITHNPKTPSSSSSSNLSFFSSSRFPSHSHNLSSSFSPRSPLLPLPRLSSSDSSATVADAPQPQTSETPQTPVPKWEKGLFAVVMIGGRQFIVHPGRWIVVQRLKGAKVNDKIALHKVLLVGTDTSTYIGKPIVTNAVVYATVEEQGLDDKVMVFKFKRKKHYKRTIGHRQPNTRIRINSIMGYENYPKVTLEDVKKKYGL